MTRDKSKAQALAYLDARDVMDRLDEVCGPENWQTKYDETARGRVLCSIGISIGDEWVWKSDGAGNTAVEGEKGGISDSLKRAAVQWGIGRYLYRMKATWVPCEVNDKGQWRKWKADPWAFAKPGAYQATLPDDPSDDTDTKPEPFNPAEERDRIKHSIEGCRTLPGLQKTWIDNGDTLLRIKDEKPAMYSELETAKNKRKSELTANDPAMQAPPDNEAA